MEEYLFIIIIPFAVAVLYKIVTKNTHQTKINP